MQLTSGQNKHPIQSWDIECGPLHTEAGSGGDVTQSQPAPSAQVPGVVYFMQYHAGVNPAVVVLVVLVVEVVDVG